MPAPPFISLREGEKIAAATLRKCRTFTRQPLALAESRGHVMLDQLTSGVLDVFYGSLKLGRDEARTLIGRTHCVGMSLEIRSTSRLFVAAAVGKHRKLLARVRVLGCVA